MHTVVFMRHGESQYNVMKRFAGWVDCGLTDRGISEARRGGTELSKRGYSFDLAYSSALLRASETMRFALHQMGLRGIPCRRSWMLNERHYGGLDGLTAEEVELVFGKETLRMSREDFNFSPPKKSYAGHPDSRESTASNVKSMPQCESMHEASLRCWQFWTESIMPAVASGNRVLVVAHGEILRLLTGRLLGVSESQIARSPVIPNATPWVFRFGCDFSVQGHQLLELDPVLRVTPHSDAEDTSVAFLTEPLPGTNPGPPRFSV
jgi:2,3-bisphosphoglycerate-dependent phosphoglycerate mutase